MGYGMLVDGIATISGPEIDFAGPEISGKISCFADWKENSSEISGPEIPKFRD